MDVTSSSAGTFGPCRLDYNRYLLESALGDHSEPHGSGYQGLAVPLWEGAGSDFDQNATPVYFASCPFVNGAGVRRVRIVDCVLREQNQLNANLKKDGVIPGWAELGSDGSGRSGELREGLLLHGGSRSMTPERRPLREQFG